MPLDKNELIGAKRTCICKSKHPIFLKRTITSLYILPVKNGGRYHSLFILNIMQTNTIGPHQNLSNEINLGVLENRPTV